MAQPRFLSSNAQFPGRGLKRRNLQTNFKTPQDARKGSLGKEKMKMISKFAILPALLIGLASAAYADSVTLNSGACTGATSSCTNGNLAYLGSASMPLNEQGPNPTAALSAPNSIANTTNLKSYVVNANGVWTNPIAGTSWVSNNADAGPASTPPSSDGTVVDPNAFYYYETSFSVVGGTYSGSISVMADDTAEVLLDGVVIVPFGAIGADNHCSAGQPACTTVDTVTLTDISLLAGNNTLEIINAQTALSEPSSLLLMGSGLAGLAMLVFWKGKASRLVLHS
jgi:hypothetical protein